MMIVHDNRPQLWTMATPLISLIGAAVLYILALIAL